jgi:hypothetical protein
MKFEAVRCDECGRIQGEANHWVQVQAIVRGEECAGIVVGPIEDNVITAGNFSMYKLSARDLCGQACAVKHIGKLLKWNPATEAQG